MKTDPVQPVPSLALDRIDDVNPAARRKMVGGCAPVKGDPLGRGGPVAQLQPQMPPIDSESLGAHHLDLTAEQQRFAVADAEGRQLLDFLVKAGLEVGKRRGGFDPDRTRKCIAIQTNGSVCLQAGLQVIEPVGEYGETCGHSVSAKAMQERSARLQAID